MNDLENRLHSHAIPTLFPGVYAIAQLSNKCNN